jgi:hypothetical protein
MNNFIDNLTKFKLFKYSLSCIIIFIKFINISNKSSIAIRTFPSHPEIIIEFIQLKIGCEILKLHNLLFDNNFSNVSFILFNLEHYFGIIYVLNNLSIFH